MDYPSPSSNTRFSKTMNPEQFNQVVEAILAGKYSWACVLILRFAGYNPLHYIPYRTYNRLLKENCQYGRGGENKTDSINGENQNHATISDGVGSRKCLSEIADLAYLETVGEQNASIRGGSSYQLLELGASLFNFEWMPPK